MKQNLDLNDLSLFVQVVDAGSFSEASRQLCTPKATISRRIAKLEQQLGVALIQRNTHQFEPTHLGQQYYQYCLDLVQQAERAQHFIAQHSALKGSIRLSCPKEILDLYINDMLIEFMLKYPDINIEVESTNRHVDIIKSRLDFAIRVRAYPFKDSDIVTRTFFRSCHYLVASPKLVPQRLNDFMETDHYPILSMHLREHQWTFEHAEQGTKSFHFSPKLSCENLYLLKKSVVNGIGIAVLPDAMIQNEVKQGTLQVISPAGWQVPQFMVHAAYSSRKSLQPAARLLLDFLAEKCAEVEIEI